jgi:hypothetical protein
MYTSNSSCFTGRILWRECLPASGKNRINESHKARVFNTPEPTDRRAYHSAISQASVQGVANKIPHFVDVKKAPGEIVCGNWFSNNLFVGFLATESEVTFMALLCGVPLKQVRGLHFIFSSPKAAYANLILLAG